MTELSAAEAEMRMQQGQQQLADALKQAHANVGVSTSERNAALLRCRTQPHFMT